MNKAFLHNNGGGGQMSGWVIKKHLSFKKKKHKKNLRWKEMRRDIKFLKQNNIEFEELNSEMKARIKSFCHRYMGGYPNTDWHKFFISLSGIESEKYIPLDIFANYIEPQLNNAAHISAFEDKNLYDLIFAGYNRPDTILRYDGERFLDSDFEPLPTQEAENIFEKQTTDLLLKPSWRGTGRGRGVSKFKAKGFKELISQIEKSKKGYVIQEYLTQHKDLQNLYPESLNTVRIVTIRVDGQIEFLCSRLKIGMEGSIVDEGGYFIKIDESGKLNGPAYKTNLLKFETHGDTGKKFDGQIIPSYQKAITMCKNMHERLLHFDMVSWDIGIEENGDPIMIEMNISSQGIKYLQIANGPLFGKYTENILSKIKYNYFLNV